MDERTYVEEQSGSAVLLREGFPAGASVDRDSQFRSPRHTSLAHSEEGGTVGPDSAADSLEGRALEVVRFGEFNFCRVKLFDLSASKSVLVQHRGSDDLNSVSDSAVTTAHLQVHLLNSAAESDVAVLLVHVDGTRARQVAQVDAVVLDASRLLLENLAGGDDLTLNLTHLVLSLHVVPELGTSQHWVASENTHAVESRVRDLCADKLTANHVKLSNLQCKTRAGVRNANFWARRRNLDAQLLFLRTFF